jgi:hypothetical protein
VKASSFRTSRRTPRGIFERQISLAGDELINGRWR